MEIVLKLQVETLNEILTILSNMPFGQVNSLITELHKQAQPQVDEFNRVMAEKFASESEAQDEIAVAN